MKTLNLILTIVFIAALFSCSESYVADMPVVKDSQHNDNEYVREAATEVFDVLLGSRNQNDYESVEILPWLTKDLYCEESELSRAVAGHILPDTMFYVVNLAGEKGCAIVSDNKYLRGVVAVMPECSVNPKDRIENPGLELYMSLYKEALLNNVIDRTFEPEQFVEYMDSEALMASSEDSDWVTVTEYPVKLVQEWGQGTPYNKYCFTSDGKQAVAGCLPIAFAQTLTYFEYPQIMDGYSVAWKMIDIRKPTTDWQIEYVSRYVHKVGVLVNAKYGVSGTSAKLSDMNRVLKEFGYSFTEAKMMNEVPMIHNLYEYGPALVYGAEKSMTSAHEWVIDGALAQRRTVDNKSELRFLYHCNWGWNGSCNGYFLSTAFNPYGDGMPGYMFNYGVKVTYFLQKPNN